MSTSTQKRVLRAKSEVESSRANVKVHHEQWLAATQANPTILTKKEVHHASKAFKNCLLSLKWDCEDLEELLSVSSENCFNDPTELSELKRFAEECRQEIRTYANKLEEFESNNKIFNKHGITLPNSLAQTATTVTTIVQNPDSQYERLAEPLPISDNNHNQNEEFNCFDKNQIETSSATIYDNALYEHFDGLQETDRLAKGIYATQVFNNLTRPVTEPFVNTSESEMILEMLETEHYNPQESLLTNQSAIRRLLDHTERNKFLAVIFSFPLLLIIFLVI